MQTQKDKQAHAKNKVLFVLGSTGVGKSDLAVQIAEALRENHQLMAEVINADAMQVHIIQNT
jgi:tRNA A37 N6-isopentenylltransferase MiaA